VRSNSGASANFDRQDFRGQRLLDFSLIALHSTLAGLLAPQPGGIRQVEGVSQNGKACARKNQTGKGPEAEIATLISTELQSEI